MVSDSGMGDAVTYFFLDPRGKFDHIKGQIAPHGQVMTVDLGIGPDAVGTQEIPLDAVISKLRPTTPSAGLFLDGDVFDPYSDSEMETWHRHTARHFAWVASHRRLLGIAPETAVFRHRAHDSSSSDPFSPVETILSTEMGGHVNLGGGSTANDLCRRIAREYDGSALAAVRDDAMHAAFPFSSINATNTRHILDLAASRRLMIRLEQVGETAYSEVMGDIRNPDALRALPSRFFATEDVLSRVILEELLSPQTGPLLFADAELDPGREALLSYGFDLSSPELPPLLSATAVGELVVDKIKGRLTPGRKHQVMVAAGSQLKERLVNVLGLPTFALVDYHEERVPSPSRNDVYIVDHHGFRAVVKVVDLSRGDEDPTLQLEPKVLRIMRKLGMSDAQALSTRIYRENGPGIPDTGVHIFRYMGDDTGYRVRHINRTVRDILAAREVVPDNEFLSADRLRTEVAALASGDDHDRAIARLATDLYGLKKHHFSTVLEGAARAQGCFPSAWLPKEQERSKKDLTARIFHDKKGFLPTLDKAFRQLAGSYRDHLSQDPTSKTSWNDCIKNLRAGYRAIIPFLSGLNNRIFMDWFASNHTPQGKIDFGNLRVAPWAMEPASVLGYSAHELVEDDIHELLASYVPTHNAAVDDFNAAVRLKVSNPVAFIVGQIRQDVAEAEKGGVYSPIHEELNSIADYLDEGDHEIFEPVTGSATLNLTRPALSTIGARLVRDLLADKVGGVTYSGPTRDLLDQYYNDLADYTVALGRSERAHLDLDQDDVIRAVSIASIYRLARLGNFYANRAMTDPHMWLAHERQHVWDEIGLTLRNLETFATVVSERYTTTQGAGTGISRRAARRLLSGVSHVRKVYATIDAARTAALAERHDQ